MFSESHPRAWLLAFYFHGEQRWFCASTPRPAHPPGTSARIDLPSANTGMPKREGALSNCFPRPNQHQHSTRRNGNVRDFCDCSLGQRLTCFRGLHSIKVLRFVDSLAGRYGCQVTENLINRFILIGTIKHWKEKNLKAAEKSFFLNQEFSWLI